eukprot:3981113-Prymnesium_polylepis.1
MSRGVRRRGRGVHEVEEHFLSVHPRDGRGADLLGGVAEGHDGSVSDGSSDGGLRGGLGSAGACPTWRAKDWGIGRGSGCGWLERFDDLGRDAVVLHQGTHHPVHVDDLVAPQLILPTESGDLIESILEHRAARRQLSGHLTHRLAHRMN